MAKIERGSFTLVGTSNTTILFSDSTLLADEIEFRVDGAGTGDSVNHLCIGWMSPTQQECHSTITDTTSGTTRNASAHYNSKCISHRNVVSGTVTEVLAAARSSMATAGEFTLSISANTASFTVYFIARQY